jgi:hypothetical protein
MRKATFDYAKQLKEGIAGKPMPSGEIPVPTDKAVVQGSSVYRLAAVDINVTLLVDQQQFERLIEKSFPGRLPKVRAEVSTAEDDHERRPDCRGEDPCQCRRGWHPQVRQGGTSFERHPRQTRIDRWKGVDLAIVKRGGKFDRGPHFSIP